RASGQFDSDWYYSTYPDVTTFKRNALQHYVQHGAIEGRDPNPNFDTLRYLKRYSLRLPSDKNPFADFIQNGSDDDIFEQGLLHTFSAASLRCGIERLKQFPIFCEKSYLELNQDIAGGALSAVHHAMVYGFAEGRSIMNKRKVSLELGRVSAEVPQGPIKPMALHVPPARIGVYYNSSGNGFIREIAEDMVTWLHSAGLPGELLDETSSIENRPPCAIFVAPHEFFHLGEGRNWIHDEVVSQSFMLNTEQPQTLWFDRGMPFMLMSRGVIDICVQNGVLLSEAGIPTLHMNCEVQPVTTHLLPQDLLHPLVRVLPEPLRKAPLVETPFSERPLDLTFFGGSSGKRDAFFARSAAFLSDYKSFLYYRRFEGPHTNSQRDGILGRLASHVTGHAKISLNIHRDEYGFFEWHRIVKIAMVGGSVVVSEPCLPHPLFKPGEHFFEEAGRHMPDLIEWLIHSPDGQAKAEEVRRAAFDKIYDESLRHQHRTQLQRFILTNWTS
ncbi:MAG: hypothetical protein ACRYG8_43325, partial [Janthinobacterium lividum]